MLFLTFAATIESENSNQDLLSFEKNFMMMYGQMEIN